MNAEKPFSLENLDEFHLEIVRRPIEEICKFYREDDENVSWADVASEKNSAETADVEGAERVQVNVDASPEVVKSVQFSVDGTPEEDGVAVFLKAFLGTLAKMGAITKRRCEALTPKKPTTGTKSSTTKSSRRSNAAANRVDASVSDAAKRRRRKRFQRVVFCCRPLGRALS